MMNNLYKKLVATISFIFLFVFIFSVQSANIDLGNLKYLIKNGEPKDKIDILFVPVGFPDATLTGKIINDVILNKENKRSIGFFDIEPYKKYQNRFNFSYVDKNLLTKYDCPRNCGAMEYDEILTSYKNNFNFDFLVLLYIDGGSAKTQGGLIGVGLGNLNEDYLNSYSIAKSLLHEFSHFFGKLEDEYNVMDSWDLAGKNNPLATEPNIDTIGCPKWCSSYDLNKDQFLLDGIEYCGKAKTKAECAELRVVVPDRVHYNCWWGEPSHTIFKLKSGSKVNCLPADVGRSNVGINCQTGFGCVFGGGYFPYSWHSEKSIMEGSTEADYFDKPSKEALINMFECCYPHSDSSYCLGIRNNFIEKYKTSFSMKTLHASDFMRRLLSCDNNIGEIRQNVCFDSGDSNNLDKKGFAIQIMNEQGMMAHIDECRDQNYVQKYYCDSVTGFIQSKLESCLYGCNDGICSLDTQGISINLYPGDNLISSPTIDPLTFEEVKTFCHTAVGDRFLVYYGKEQKWYGLKKISSRQAGYVTVNEECVVKKQGEQLSRVVPLYKGYNFFSVANPQALQNMKGTCSTLDGNTSIQFFNNQSKKWEAFPFGQPLDPSLGYTMKMEKFCFLTDVAN